METYSAAGFPSSWYQPALTWTAAGKPPKGNRTIPSTWRSCHWRSGLSWDKDAMCLGSIESYAALDHRSNAEGAQLDLRGCLGTQLHLRDFITIVPALAQPEGVCCAERLCHACPICIQAQSSLHRAGLECSSVLKLLDVSLPAGMATNGATSTADGSGVWQTRSTCATSTLKPGTPHCSTLTRTLVSCRPLTRMSPFKARMKSRYAAAQASGCSTLLLWTFF